MDDRSPGHDLRCGSRRPVVLGSRSHLDPSGARSVEVMLRSTARAGDGGSAGRTPLLGDASHRSRARSGPERGSVRTKARPTRRDAGLHPTSPRGSGRECGTNRVHVFENRKKVGCRCPRPTRLGMHPGEGSVSRREDFRVSRGEERSSKTWLAARAIVRAVGSGSSPVVDRRSHEWSRDRSNSTRRDASGGNEGNPAAR